MDDLFFLKNRPLLVSTPCLRLNLSILRLRKSTVHSKLSIITEYPIHLKILFFVDAIRNRRFTGYDSRLVFVELGAR